MTAKRPILTKTVTDAEAQAHTRELLAPLMHHVVKRKDDPKPSPQDYRKRSSKPTSKSSPKSGPVKSERQVYLQSILDHPNDSVTQRKDRLGWSSYKANKRKRSVIEEGYAVELNINLGRKTRGRVVLLQLTAKGYELLGESPPDTPGFRMSPEHWWWQCAIADYYRSQPETMAEIEHHLNGKRIDVAVIRSGCVQAIEVEMTPDNAIRNAKADLEAGAEHVTIACRDTRVAKAVGERMTGIMVGAELERIRLTTLAELPVAQHMFANKERSMREGDLFPEGACKDNQTTNAKSRALAIPVRR